LIMRSNDSLGGIPITTETPKASMRLHWQRRALQIFTIVVAVLIPATGLFRIDPIAGAFVVLDRQIWWSDFFLVFGFWLLSPVVWCCCIRRLVLHFVAGPVRRTVYRNGQITSHKSCWVSALKYRSLARK